jgi:biopolymer transport protein ExbD
MSWKVRHQGSPGHAEVATEEEIAEGVADGIWEPTDEVMGPDDKQWRSLENHPRFADVIADYDPMPAIPKPEETRLDMNPLIDVALVLLIFFILTTTYVELRKEFPAPPTAGDETRTTNPIREDELKKFTIRVTANRENDETVVRVEGNPVPEHELQTAIEAAMQKTGYDRLAVEILHPRVSWGTFMAIQDAAAGAKISETLWIERIRSEVEEK